MDESLYSSENISKLVHNWFNFENSDAILEIFKVICSGPKSLDAFASGFHVEEYVAELLENSEVLDKLYGCPEECILISKCILNFDSLNERWVKILNGLVKASRDDELIDLIILHKDAEGFPVELIETCVSSNCLYLEKVILSAYRDQSTDGLHRWEIWSSKSPLVFRLTTSILNQFLHIAKDKNYILTTIERFVKKVAEICDSSGFDFVSLYPENVQKIVILILLYEKSRDENIQKLISSSFYTIKFSNYKLSVILCTHFKILHPIFKEINEI